MKPWTQDQIDTVEEMLANHATAATIGTAVGRSPKAVIAKRDKLKLTPASKADTFTIKGAVRLLGTSRGRLLTWIDRGWLTARAFGPRYRLISHEQVMGFLRNPATWAEWEIGQIRDPDWVEYAGQVRPLAYLTTRQVGAQLGVGERVITTYIRQGKIAADKNQSGFYRIRPAAIAGFVVDLSRQGTGPKPKLHAEEKEWLRLWAPRQGDRHLALALGRATSTITAFRQREQIVVDPSDLLAARPHHTRRVRDIHD